MNRAPRRRSDRVIDLEMWMGFLLTGSVMAIVTLATLDWSLPNGFIPGTHDMTYARTLAFTTLVFCQLFNVFCSRSDYDSAFRHLFNNRLLWGAVLLSVVLQIAVIYIPFLNEAFQTTPIAAVEWAICIVMASMVLWVDEIKKLILRATGHAARKTHVEVAHAA
jgi:Ca2+-transporting ATPase